MAKALGLLDAITGQLDQHKDRLGPFYRPLYVLSGALAFLVFFATLVGLPVVLLEDFAYVAFVQIFLIAVYFMLLLAIQWNVFDRFVYAAVLFVVTCAAPVLISSQGFLQLLTAGRPEFFPQEVALPKVELFLYAVLRGMGNLGWALPVLFVFFTFYPHIERRAASGETKMETVLRRMVLLGLGLHVVAVCMILWRDAVIQRTTASTEGAGAGVKRAIEFAQRGYLGFSLAYLAVGFVILAVLWWLAHRGRVRDREIHTLVAIGLAATQFLYFLATWNAVQLNLRYPGARTTASSVHAFREIDTGKVVYTHPFFDNVSREKLGSRWQPYAACLSPEAGRFTYRIGEAAEFYSADGRFREVDLFGLLAAEDEEERGDTVFCQE